MQKKVCFRRVTKFFNTSQFLTPHKYEMDATRPDQPLMDKQHKDYKDSVPSRVLLAQLENFHRHGVCATCWLDCKQGVKTWMLQPPWLEATGVNISGREGTPFLERTSYPEVGDNLFLPLSTSSRLTCPCSETSLFQVFFRS